jgi:hypothetical protein
MVHLVEKLKSNDDEQTLFWNFMQHLLREQINRSKMQAQ